MITFHFRKIFVLEWKQWETDTSFWRMRTWQGFTLWSSGEDSALPMQGEQVQTLNGELRSCNASWHGQKKFFFKKDDSEEPEFRQKQ